MYCRLFLVSLISALLLPFTACNSCMEACEMFPYKELTFKNPFHLSIDIGEELCGQKVWGRKDLEFNSWGEPLTLKRLMNRKTSRRMEQ